MLAPSTASGSTHTHRSESNRTRRSGFCPCETLFGAYFLSTIIHASRIAPQNHRGNITVVYLRYYGYCIWSQRQAIRDRKFTVRCELGHAGPTRISTSVSRWGPHRPYTYSRGLVLNFVAGWSDFPDPPSRWISSGGYPCTSADLAVGW